MPPMAHRPAAADRLSVVLPCYNEGAGLAELVERWAAVGAGLDLEVVLVENGSSDDSRAIMDNLARRHGFLRIVAIDDNQGYGHGIATGLAAASGTWVGWSHADLQTDPADVIQAYRLLRASPEPRKTLVKGVRTGRGMAERIITWGMQAVATVLLRRFLHEINAQPKVFHRNLLGCLTNPPPDFNFDVYALYRARRAGWRLVTIPVRFPPRRHGQSNWAATWASKWRTIRRSFAFMFRLGAGIWPEEPRHRA